MDSKQRAKLKSMAHDLEAIIQIGKNGVTDETIKVVGSAFNNKELIKIKIIESCPEEKQEIANKLATKTGSEVVQIIGSKIVLYKKNLKQENINKNTNIKNFFQKKQEFSRKKTSNQKNQNKKNFERNSIKNSEKKQNNQKNNKKNDKNLNTHSFSKNGNLKSGSFKAKKTNQTKKYY